MSSPLHVPNGVAKSHTKVLQIALLGIVALVAAALPLAQQLYQCRVRARRLRHRRLQTGLVLVVVIMYFLGRGRRWNWHRGGSLVRLC